MRTKRKWKRGWRTMPVRHGAKGVARERTRVFFHHQLLAARSWMLHREKEKEREREGEGERVGETNVTRP